MEAVESRPEMPVAKALDLHERAAALAFRVAEVTAHGLSAATRMNSAGDVMVPAARETMMWPFSSGWGYGLQRRTARDGRGPTPLGEWSQCDRRLVRVAPRRRVE